MELLRARVTVAVSVMVILLAGSCGRKGEQAGKPPPVADRPAERQGKKELQKKKTSSQPQQVKCSVCGRKCESNRAVIAKTPEKEYQFCCAYCLKKHIRQGEIDPKTDTIVFHDYATGDEIKPEETFIVTGIDLGVNCSRAVATFGDEARAEEFLTAHRAKLFTWQEYLNR